MKIDVDDLARDLEDALERDRLEIVDAIYRRHSFGAEYSPIDSRVHVRRILRNLLEERGLETLG